MKINRLLFLLLACMIPVLYSCEKSPDAVTGNTRPAPVSLDSMLRCYNSSTWDSAGIRNTLTGRWNWEFIKCYWNPEDANGDDYKGLSVNFKPNDSLEVTMNGVLTQSASWKISRLTDGYYKLNVTPMVPQLYGQIICCSNRLLFYDSYIDGCDQYFKK